MVEYKVLFKNSVWKDFESIPKAQLIKIVERIDALSRDPRPNGSQKLSGHERYRIRQGRYRILYSIQDNELTVYVVKVAHRKEVYR
jgi:mRNA interferase RelE/StbE